MFSFTDSFLNSVISLLSFSKLCIFYSFISYVIFLMSLVHSEIMYCKFDLIFCFHYFGNFHCLYWYYNIFHSVSFNNFILELTLILSVAHFHVLVFLDILKDKWFRVLSSLPWALSLLFVCLFIILVYGGLPPRCTISVPLSQVYLFFYFLHLYSVHILLNFYSTWNSFSQVWGSVQEESCGISVLSVYVAKLLWRHFDCSSFVLTHSRSR